METLARLATDTSVVLFAYILASMSCDAAKFLLSYS